MRPPGSVADIVELAVVARGLKQPVILAQPPGDDRLFVAERGGRILILRDGGEPTVFADLSPRVTAKDRQQGLLGLAFHPEFLDRSRVYVNYTGRADNATYVVEFGVEESDLDAADPASERELLRIGQPWPQHNGGHLAFGPDGALYIGTGDGGGSGDPRGHAQRCDSWRGKMLRMDVDAEPLAVEVIHIGLGNPWRYSFDRKTGDLYLADVGASSWELLYAVSATNLVGHNFGWNIATGSRCRNGEDCDRRGFTAPILEYDRSVGCAIIGGYVYRGRAIPELDGAYFFSDYCSGMLRSLRWKSRQLSDYWDWDQVLDPRDHIRSIVSFGEDQAGELYILTRDGTIYKLQRKSIDRSL